LSDAASGDSASNAQLKNSSDGATSERASDGLLTKRGLAPKLQISARTLDDWMRRGRVPFLKVGKSVRFRWDDVLEKLNQFRVN
jgi:excisionase family DNA binding protein